MQEAKMSFIGKLAAGIAHQLNNPTYPSSVRAAGGLFDLSQGPGNKQGRLRVLLGLVVELDGSGAREGAILVLRPAR